MPLRRLLRPLSSLLLVGLASPAQQPERNVSGGPLLPEQGCFDVKHYELVLAVDPEQKSIDGRLTMRAVATGDCRNLALDLDPALRATRISVDGDAAAFRHERGRLWFSPVTAPQPGQQFRVVVDYGGKPHVAKNPPWDGGFTWSATRDGKPWVATSCQGEGADLWWPCKDHPSDKPDGVDLHITVPKDLVVASNGTLQSDVAKGPVRTFHWRVQSPISNYCVALNIAPYRRIDDTYTCVDGTKLPVQFFALPEHEAKAKQFLPQFLDHLRVFEEILGPYPFRHEKYGIAETPHLGMEHQTIIAYGNRFRDARYDWLHNHELAHEWWGNLVTCRDWKDMWIHEGFGTYMQPLYLERLYGRKSEAEGRKAYAIEMQRYNTVNLAPVAPRQVRDSHQIYFGPGGSNDIYFKGAWVLHTLRWHLGDERFFQCLRRFCYPTKEQERATDGSQVRLVDTDDFVALCSEIAGSDQGWFFEVYVRQPKLPALTAEVVDGVLRLSWRVPGGTPFPLAVPVQVGEKTMRVEMPDGKGQLEVGKRDWRIDPDKRLLRERD